MIEVQEHMDGDQRFIPSFSLRSEYNNDLRLTYLEEEASYHELYDTIKSARIGLKRYSTKRKRRIRGNLPVAFTTEQLKMFFGSAVLRGRWGARIAFLRMLFYGMRVSEACGAMIVPGQNIIRIWSEKMDRYEYLPLIPGTEQLFAVEINHSQAYLAKVFRLVRNDIGLNWSYAESSDHRPLYQFSTHSFRHTAGNWIYKLTNSEYKMHVFLRHETNRIYGATAAYMHYDWDEMKEDMINASTGMLMLNNL